jgi:hypothetical protein
MHTRRGGSRPARTISTSIGQDRCSRATRSEREFQAAIRQGDYAAYEKTGLTTDPKTGEEIVHIANPYGVEDLFSRVDRTSPEFARFADIIHHYFEIFKQSTNEEEIVLTAHNAIEQSYLIGAGWKELCMHYINIFDFAMTFMESKSDLGDYGDDIVESTYKIGKRLGKHLQWWTALQKAKRSLE